MLVRLLHFAACLAVLCVSDVVLAEVCGPSLKDAGNGTCISVTNYDVYRAMNWLAKPPQVACKNITTIQDIAVCEDELPKDCVVWSELSSNWCDHYGSLQFEKYWSQRGCAVTLFHYTRNFRANVCTMPDGKMADYPNIKIVRGSMWKGPCYNCFYDLAKSHLLHVNRIDVLKIQSREGVNEDFDGIQYSVMSDLYMHLPQVAALSTQIVMTVSINTRTMSDNVGRESSHAWNMWGTQRLLQDFAAFSTRSETGPRTLQPLQFSHLLLQAKLDPSIGTYRQSFIRTRDAAQLAQQHELFDKWQPAPPEYELRGRPPAYCLDKTPAEGTTANNEMQEWILGEMNARCHATRLHVPCERNRGYDSIVPCPQELMNNLAEDYAVTQGWCDFTHKAAHIEALGNVDAGAYTAFKQPALTPLSSTNKNGIANTANTTRIPINTFMTDGTEGRTGARNVRLAFFFTVYADVAFVTRLFKKLYSPTHYYMFHLDASVGSVSSEFASTMRTLADTYSNVYLAQDVPIVYGASTATILLTKAMAWFDKHATGWDYFVPLTGSDYPLIPLARIEEIFTHQQPPMPFVMAWTPGTSTHIFRLEKTHPVFETDPLIVRSIKAVTDERGKVLGAVPMEFRSNNFGPPLFCSNRSTFVHLDNRQNKSARILDTQWLFPKDTFRGRGRAYAEEDPSHTTPSFDKQWRVWKKSDPATTGAYDRESVSYIINSVEGRKYYHFFKHMLLGSEEHYYVSLLYNWPRTKAFVQSLSAQIVWNTWELGLWEQSEGFQTHTHFLSLNEWDILAGFSKRGMMFARKFSTKKTAALLDRIDQMLLKETNSNEAGRYWPGFYKVDTTTPGKEWVADYRRNQKLRAIAQKKEKESGNKLPHQTMRGGAASIT